MYEKYLHAYETLSLHHVGILLGIALILGHLIALIQPKCSIKALSTLYKQTLLGQILLGIALTWFMLLLIKAPWNALTIELYEFENIRTILIIACPVTWFILSSMVKENIFGRALGLFLILLACPLLTAAFLKDPVTRILIPLWCYPVLTAGMFFVAKPYLFRDATVWISQRPRLFFIASLAGLLYGIAILSCAILYW